MVAVSHPRLQPAEYLALQANAGWRLAVELFAGEAVVTPPSGGRAASVQGELFYALRRWQETSDDAGLLLQDVFVRLSGDSYLAPDIAWWTAGRRPALAQGALEILPDLVVEVLAPATRSNDLGVKRDAYLNAGIRELWLADPEAARLTVVRAHGVERTVDRHARLGSPLLPGAAIDLSAVFPT